MLIELPNGDMVEPGSIAGVLVFEGDPVFKFKDRVKVERPEWSDIIIHADSPEEARATAETIKAMIRPKPVAPKSPASRLDGPEMSLIARVEDFAGFLFGDGGKVQQATDLRDLVRLVRQLADPESLRRDNPERTP